jgi:H+/Cl- antiporter ClcA
MSTFRMDSDQSGTLAIVRMVGFAIGIGAGLGVLTKASLWLYSSIIYVVWEWLPETLGLVADAPLFMLVVMVGGGILVGLGQLILGYQPQPLEEIVKQVRDGSGIDYRAIPPASANTVAALAAGAPLGPESGLITIIGGLYFWAKQRMEATAVLAYGLVTGREGESTPWRYAPTILAGLAALVVFRALSDGENLSFVPAYEGGDDIATLALAFVTGAAGGVLGLVARTLEDRGRALRLFARAPLISAPIGGFIFVLLALPSTLVLFSGHEQMAALFERPVAAGELLYAGAAKLVAMVVVIAAGWKGGTIFPLMFIAGALAVGIADVLGLQPVVLYAAAIGGTVAGALRSIALGLFISFIVVPTALAPIILVGAAAGVIVLRLQRTQAAPPVPSPS